ncbi:MAG: GntR family transcriptional regulator [Phycisphaeraceae bacterium]|nr:GntR family transcriptional regulator [Phycisphaeraceae bacterium]
MMTSTDKAYGHLRHMLMRGDLTSGSRVSELKLASQLGMSRTPIRAAVRRLRDEGLVHQVPRGGTVISRPTLRDLLDLYELRESLESRAAYKAARYASDEEIEGLNQLCQHMLDILPKLKSGETLTKDDIHQIGELDVRFHLELMRLGGNMRSLRIVNDMQLFEKLFFIGGLTWPSIRPNVLLFGFYRGHRKVVRMIQKRDPRRAAKAMIAHVRSGRREVVRLYRKRLRHIAKEAVNDF